MHKLLVAGTTALAALLVHVAGAGVPAHAAVHGGIVSADPVDWTPHVLDGRVRGLATVGDITVAVGNFSQVREQGSSTVLSRPRIFAFDGTGTISSTFQPDVDGPEIFDVVDAGDGQTVYVAGNFKNIDGARRTARVARLDVNTGEVVSTFRAPASNRKATDIELVGDRLFVAGWFTRVGGQPRTLLTALDATTGARQDDVDLTFSGTFNGGRMGAVEMTVQPDGTDLVIMGNFTHVNGLSRPQVAMIDLTGPTATLSSWHTARYATRCHRSFETYMWGIDGSPDGTYFAIGTTGAFSGGVASGTLCDAVARWEWDRSGPDQNPTWVDYAGGDTVTDIDVTDAAVYAGGHFRWFNNPYAGDRVGPGAVRRMGLVALDPRNGLPYRWNPGRARGWGVWGFNSTDQGLWIGHDTDRVGNETHERVALMPLDATGVVPPDNTGSLPDDLYLVAQPAGGGFDDRVVRRSFDGTSAGDATEVDSSGYDWSSAQGTFMVDGWLFTAWDDGTMTRQPYNSRQFLTVRDVGLQGLTAFADEMEDMSSMWFDGETGRLYFTLEGTDRLYYRYFTPESRTVGAVRFEVPTHDVDFSQVTGGFLDGGQLYYRTDAGQLRRVSWNDGPVSGTSTTVSGPGTDGTDWSSGSLFLYAD